MCSQIIQVCLGSRNCSDAGTGEADFAGGAEFINHIRVASLFTLGKQLQDNILRLVIQMMYVVSIVPENTEILCRRL